MALNPIVATEEIRKSYINYLSTTFFVKDETLQENFVQLLNQPKKLIKGPYLEATPLFENGKSIAELISEGVLSKLFAELKSVMLPLDRPLYTHQEMAIRKVVSGRNVIVATGTGSGKTESFLVPILNHLFREQEKGQLSPGVRALLLYPMNALANDQLARLRILLKKYPNITFGRYTGETEPEYKKALEKFHKVNHQEPLPNELIAREQMWGAPPHILLTNYAMLEYLLLRPTDSSFFDGKFAKSWRFLVLDEVHTYAGAKGIEIAMLLRRLKDRIVQSEPGRIQCIGTSATLGGPEDFPQTIKFAQELFGEKFEWEGDSSRRDVVEAVKLPLSIQIKAWGTAEPGLYHEWKRIVEDPNVSIDALHKCAEKNKVPKEVLDEAYTKAESWKAYIYEILKGDQRVIKLQQELQESPQDLSDIAEKVFSSGEVEALVALVELANKAIPKDGSRPLLPARYHLFVRALEGAFLQLHPEKKLLIERQNNTYKGKEENAVFEMAVCSHCGAVYLTGQLIQKEDKQILDESFHYDATHHFYLRDEEEEIKEIDEDEAVENNQELNLDELKNYYLCGKCGAIAEVNSTEPPCDCDDSNYRVVVEASNNKGQVTSCLSCGRSSSRGIVRRVTVGSEAAASVLTSALYQKLEPSMLKEETSAEDTWAVTRQPTNIKKRNLLVFSDSRQDAAYFAPYFQRTYDRIIHRNLIIKVLEKHKDTIIRNRWCLQDLVYPYREEAVKLGFFRGLSRQEQQNEIWKRLIFEFMGHDVRFGLESMGLLNFNLIMPDNWAPPKALMVEPWKLNEQEVETLYRIMLDSLRKRGVVTFPDFVDPSDEFFKPRNRAFYVRGNGSSAKKGIYSWNPTPSYYNSRLDFIFRMAQKINPEISLDQSRDLLSNLWERGIGLTDGNSLWQDHFNSEIIRAEGAVYQLKHSVWEIQSPLLGTGAQWYICNKCNTVTTLNLKGVCPRYRCKGELQPCDPMQVFSRNHYQQLYLNSEPLPMKIEEHTAQLTSEAAADTQKQFVDVDGKVNILSCSTTFELGVDVGDLEAVFMRNMPPAASNYIQRAGRAGRRTEATAFALTYAQQRPHDIDHYHEPLRMVSGRTKAPYFKLENKKIILRHIYAVALSKFWRQYSDCFRKVEDFFFNEVFPAPQRLEAYLQQQPGDLNAEVQRIVPAGLKAEFLNWQWSHELMVSRESLMKLVTDEVTNDVAEIEELREKLSAEGKENDYLIRLLRTIKSKSLINYLSSKNILPKYGFPVDVVSLQLSNTIEAARRLQLDRDLKIAISEYAPGSQVVAGGKLWTSRYIKRLQQKEWESFKFAICSSCQSYQRLRAQSSEQLSKCSLCGSDSFKSNGIFIIPSFGFIADIKSNLNPGEQKPDRTYSSRVYYSGEAEKGTMLELKLKKGITLSATPATHGKLAVFNNSMFKVCYRCGYTLHITDKTKENPHPTPWGGQCSGTLYSPRYIGHEFETDILILKFDYQTSDESFWVSLLYSLLEGASEALQIERQDLDACLYGNPQSPFLVLFDDVPGGAGHVQRMADQDVLQKILRSSLNRLKRCECGGKEANASCYGCLRNYRNQAFHNLLNRGVVIGFLESCI